MKNMAIVDLEEYRKTGDYAHFVGLATPGFLGLAEEDQSAIIGAFMEAPRGDHFYSVSLGGIKAFIAENGEHGYTAMLPQEY